MSGDKALDKILDEGVRFDWDTQAWKYRDSLEADLIAWRDAARREERERAVLEARSVPNIIPNEIANHPDEHEKQIWVQGWLTGNVAAARRIEVIGSSP